MKEAVFVKIGKSSGDIEEDGSDFIFGEGTTIFLGASIDLIKIAFEIVKDHVEFRIGKNDLFELDDVGMF